MIFCPLMSKRSTCGYTECVKEKCAWYSEYKGKCCIKILSENIEDVTEGQRTIYTREV